MQLSNSGGDPLNGDGRLQEQVSQEFQVNGEALEGGLSYVTGAFLFWENGNDVSVTQAVPEVLNSVTEGTTKIDNFTWALFGQATRDMTEWASLTGGVRYTSDKKELGIISRDPRADAPPTVDEANSKTFDAWTPMGSLAFTLPEDLMGDTPLDHLMGYFTYSRGFKGGGFNGVINPQVEELLPFDPETLDMDELGFKTIGFDQRVTFNLALFYGGYSDLQVTGPRGRRRP
ncbi:MAG: TonB-dependent receptor [Candidatus Binatia bacterium]|nr:TonB-dependent receptor [Candidatus Binatia bacterium]